MKKWNWIRMPTVLMVHDWVLAQDIGLDGVRDMGAVESAIARPMHLHSYGESRPGPLAAAYTFGLVKNHGFVDGNKRTAWGVTRIFLKRNGFALTFEKAQAVRMMERLADGSASEEEISAWFSECMKDTT